MTTATSQPRATLSAPAARPYLIPARAFPLVLAALLALLVVSILLAVSVGAVALSVGEVWRVILRHLTGLGAMGDAVNDRIVWQLRTPRVLLALVVGAGLSVAGATLQAVVRNPLADPYILGTSAGASLGAVAVLVLGSAALGGLGLSAAAFLGALASVTAVFLLGQRAGAFAPTRLVLAGVAIGYLCSSLTAFLQYRAQGDQLRVVLFWLLGSVAGARWGDLGLPAAVVFLTTIWLVVQGRRLNTLLLGEESATALGVDVNRFRLGLMIATSLLTGTAVAVAGGIGFVGLMIPHIVRLAIGPDHRKLMLVAALLGGSYLIWVDLAARTLQRPTELPLGIITGVVGAPFFIWLMRRSSRVGGAA